MNNFGKKDVRIQDHQKFMDHNTKKWAKCGVYQLRWQFDRENELFWL